MSIEAAVAMLIMRRRDKVSDKSSSSSDEKWETALQERTKRKRRPRIDNYIDIIIRYSDNEFKSHFRISRATFDYLHDILREDLIRRISGCSTIPSVMQHSSILLQKLHLKVKNIKL